MNIQAEKGRTLLPHHRKEFHRSGLCDQTIKVARFFSVSREEAKGLLGFDPGSGGWVIPYPHRTGLDELIHFKPDVSFKGPDGRERKYLFPKRSQSRVYVPPVIPTENLQNKRLPLWIVEGEKKALEAAQEGIVCIAIPGVWNWRYRDEHDDSRTIPDLFDIWLKGRDVNICFDSDIIEKPSVKKAEYALAEKLRTQGAIVSGVRLPSGENGEKVGVDDYLLNHTVEDLRNLPRDPLDAPPAFTVDQWLTAYESGNHEEKPDIQEIIPALSQMSPLAYEAVRERVAKAAGVRVSVLDSQVESRRPKKEERKAIGFRDIHPWDEEVEGAALLDELSGWLSRYVVLPKGAADAVSAWVIATWLKDELFFAPILALLSATKRSGKTTLLDLIRFIAFKGFLTSGVGITPAVLFRVNEKYHPTLLIDEAEKLSGDDGAKELIGLINTGHKRGGTVFRCDPVTHEPAAFDAFGFRAVAAIGTLWDTIFDRGIVIRMIRKAKDAKVERFTSRTVEEEGSILARKIARWINDNRKAVIDLEGKAPRPSWLNDRACDNWSPLFAVGMVAGEGWLDRLLKSAKTLQPSSDENEGRGEMLIRDIKTIFEEKENPVGIQSGQLVDTLNLIETSPWGDYRKGKGLSTQGLAKMLKPFGIRPKHFRDGIEDVRGYKFEWLKDAFDRYLPPTPPSNCHKPSQANKNNDLDSFSNCHKEGDSDPNCHRNSPYKSNSYEDVTVSDHLKGGSKGKEEKQGIEQWDLL